MSTFTFPPNTASGLFVTSWTAPPVVPDPNNVPWGPLSTSILSTSKNSASYEIFQDYKYPFTINNENDLDGLVYLLQNLNIVNYNYDFYNDIYLKRFSYSNFISSISK